MARACFQTVLYCIEILVCFCCFMLVSRGKYSNPAILIHQMLNIQMVNIQMVNIQVNNHNTTTNSIMLNLNQLFSLPAPPPTNPERPLDTLLSSMCGPLSRDFLLSGNVQKLSKSPIFHRTQHLGKQRKQIWAAEFCFSAFPAINGVKSTQN